METGKDEVVHVSCVVMVMSWCQRPCVVPDKSSCHVPHSGKFALGANFLFIFYCANRSAFAETKAVKKLRLKLMMSNVNEMVLYSLSVL